MTATARPLAWRALLCAFLLALLSSCGGGDGGGGFPALGAASGTAGNGSPAAGAGNGTGTGGGSDAGGAAGGGGTGSGGSTSGSGGGGTSTAGNGTGGGDDGGVGSGGTGVGVAADATSVGSVDGLGSVIVNSLRYETPTATVYELEDTAALAIGMSVRVTARADAAFTAGTALRVRSAADVRGAVDSVDLAGDGSFVVLGNRLTVDPATVWADSAGLAALAVGTPVQVWALPTSAGTLRATRVQTVGVATAPVLSGVVRQLDRASGSFLLGGVRVSYTAAVLDGMAAGELVDGAVVRVRAAVPAVAGVLQASRIEAWYPLPAQSGTPVQLSGVMADFASLASFRLLGVAVDASAAAVTGGLATSLGNGVRVEIDGVRQGQTVVASKLRIRHVPGTGGPARFTLIGAVGGYRSAADFRVQGQPVDASVGSVVFVNGHAGDLANGRRVRVTGTAVREGVLLADTVQFE
ncbi:hypothetical protein DBA29_18280 [Xenophilus aerolatus]|nr:hypothetical protein [Xenophilus aerolatus]